jgi:hypothetical protein
MSLGHNHKVILQIHAIRRHTRSNTHTPTLSKEKRSSISQLHPSKIDTKTTIRTCPKSTECTFGRCALLFSLKPAGGVEARMYVSELVRNTGLYSLHVSVWPKVFVSVHGVCLGADCGVWRDKISIECCAALGYYSGKTTRYCTVQTQCFIDDCVKQRQLFKIGISEIFSQRGDFLFQRCTELRSGYDCPREESHGISSGSRACEYE